LLFVILVCSDIFVSYKNVQNDVFLEKLSLLQKNRKSYDVVFYGSSLIHKQIKPAIFDQITGLHSYNFGLAGVTAFDKNNSFLLMLRKGIFDDTDYLFLETGLFYRAKVRRRKSKSSGAIHFYLTSDFLRELAFVISAGASVERKGVRLAQIFKLYFMSRAKWLAYFEFIPSEDRPLTNLSKDGYQSLGEMSTGKVSSRRAKLLKAPEYLDELRVISSRAITENRAYPVPPVILHYYEFLIAQCQKHNIHLVLLFHPKTASLDALEEGYYIQAISASLPPEHVLNFTDMSRFPQLNQLEYNYDRGHFNDAGATLYTSYLAQDFMEKIYLQSR